MTVRALSADSTTLPIGGVWGIVVSITDADGAPAAGAPVVTITLPDGTDSTPTVETVTAGVYRAQATVAAAGRYVARVVDPTYGAADFTAYVEAVTAAAGMPVLTDVLEYLGDTSATNDEVQSALDAEASAQRDVCRIPAVYPASLREALLRRVARNLALRGIPLAVLRGDGEVGDTVLPGRDPEVRRLERPYPKWSVG